MKSYKLFELAKLIDAELIGDADKEIMGLAALGSAKPNQLTFLADIKKLDALQTTQAGAVLVTDAMQQHVTSNKLITSDPYLCYAKLSHLWDAHQNFQTGIDSSAVIADDAVIGENVFIGANVFIAKGVTIAEGSYIAANVSIAANSQIGKHCKIYANVSIYHDVKIGDACIIHSNTVIGADGFGFANDKGKWVKIAQLGGVSIGNHVEIGASTTIDRGALADTVIADGVILDNQVHVAHNVSIGEDTAIAGCSAIAGSTSIGARCRIAGRAAIVGHINIADDVVIPVAQTMVTKSLEKGSYASGVLTSDYQDWRKNALRFNQLDKMAKQLKRLQKEFDVLKSEAKDDN